MSAPSLPHSLVSFIQAHFPGEVNPTPADVQNTLGWDDRGLNTYIYTYFPRSFIESRTVFTELLSSRSVRAALASKPVLRVLDLGSGTGGAVLGLAYALRAAGLLNRPISIVSVDGNPLALEKQRALWGAARADLDPADLRLTTLPSQFSRDYSDFLAQLDQQFDIASDLAGGDFDLILSSKFINEQLRHMGPGARDLYARVAEISLDHLSQGGLLTLLDVTNPVWEENEYLPILLAEGARPWIGSKRKHGVLLPHPCRATSACQDSCFTNRLFEVRAPDPEATVLTTKVSYRVWADLDLYNAVATELPVDGPRLVNYSKNRACFRGLVRDADANTPSGWEIPA